MQRRSLSKRSYQMTNPFPLDPYPPGRTKPPEWNQEEEWDEE